MGDIVPYRPPRERQESTARLGMVLFLGSWAMVFGGLFFAYGMVRARAPVWPPLDVPTLPIALPACNTLLLVLSSVSLHLGLRAVGQGRLLLLRLHLWGAAILALAFLTLQLMVWGRLHAEGLRPSSGTYASVFYALTWFHALHVLVGLFALGWLIVRAGQGAYNAPRHLPIRLWAMYCHFVGIVWVAMFVLVYLV